MPGRQVPAYVLPLASTKGNRAFKRWDSLLPVLPGTTPSATTFLRHYQLFTNAQHVISKAYLLTWVATRAWRKGLKITAPAQTETRLSILKYGENHIIIRRVGFYREKRYLWSRLLKKEAIKCNCLVSIPYLNQHQVGTIETISTRGRKHWRFTVYEDTVPVSMNITTICSSSNIHWELIKIILNLLWLFGTTTYITN